MKKPNYLKKAAMFIGGCCLALSIMLSPGVSITSHAATSSDSTVQPYSDVIKYAYKVENGKLYKRLYNTSTRVWIGPWIYVCEYPG